MARFSFFLCNFVGLNMEQLIPKIAIIDPNTLAALGLKQMLQTFMPMMEVDVYGSLEKLKAANVEQYVHFFAAMNMVLEDRAFFLPLRRKTMVLTTSADADKQLKEFHCLCVNVPEAELVRSLIMLEQRGHEGGRNMPPMPRGQEQPLLSDREAEVMVLIVKGFINKEIAERLHIALATVITHRKNIMEKLGVKSVSALTIYAVMHGYVDINKI